MRNIRLAYILAFCFHAWFWIGTWIFFYLRFGSYATVVLLDGVAILVSLIMEIPTGALGDLLGKRKTLMMAFLLQGIGNIMMGLSGSFWMLAISLWMFVCVGGSLYSGTAEALVYDSLKEDGKEDLFHRKISNVKAVRLVAMAACGVIGGSLYLIWPGLVYVLDGVFSIIGFGVCFFLIEPGVDTEKFNWTSFFKQNIAGFKALFRNSELAKLSIFLVVTGAFCVFIYQMLDDLLAVEYGFGPRGISYLFSAACVVAGIASALIPRLWKKVDIRRSLVISMMVMAFLLSLSPFVGMYVGGGLLIVRVLMEVINENATSVVLNRNLGSEVRATALSTLNLLKMLPYSVAALLLGDLLQKGGAKNIAMYYGFVLLVVTMILGGRLGKRMRIWR